MGGDIVFARPPRTRCGPPSLREKLRVPDTVKLPPVDAPSPYASGSSYAAYYERLMQHAARMVKILYAPPRNGRVAAALQPVTDAYEGYYVDSSFRDLELKEDETGERERGRWGWTGSSWLKARTDDEEEVVPSAKGLGASAVAARVQRLSVRMDGDVDQVMDKSESAPPSPPPPPVLKPTDINANASTALVLIPPPPVPPPTPNYTPTKFSTHFIRMPTSSNATTVEPIHPGTTTIDCAVLDPNVPERYCRTRNLAVRLALVPRVDAREEFDLNPLYGAARATCALNETWWFHGRMFGKGGAGWLYSGMEIVEPEGEYGEIKWDTTNPYQAHQDFLNTFLVYSALDLDASETQAILLDSRYKDGPFTSAWSHVFSGSRRLMDIRQLADEVLARLPRHKPDPVLCFKDAAWGIHGGISPLSRGASRKDFCSSSPLILAFRSFMLDRLRLAILGPRRAGTTTPPILASDTTTTMSLATAVMERLPLPQELLLPSERHPPISIPTRILSDPIMTQRDALRRALKESAARMRDQHRTITVLYTIRGNGTPLRTVAGLNGEALQGLGSARGGDDVEATSTSPSREPEPLQRKVENEAELIDYLRGVCESWGGVNSTRLLEHGAGRSRGRWGVVDMSRGGGNFTCEFRAVDMAGLTFERQVALAQGTDLLVGAHGAVFIHMMYLRRQPRAAVFEMQPPSRRNGNEQFGNLAGKLGHIYERTSIGKGVSEKEMGIVGQKVRGLLESLKAGRLEHGL
ncbi:hypothetical protein HK101_007186 [Irineochytrium annulatum]|nr:hypothetical protein HK101_007186 [Irineochytrium annulatum]